MLIIDLFKQCDVENLTEASVRFGFLDKMRILPEYKAKMKKENPEKELADDETILKGIVSNYEKCLKKTVGIICKLSVRPDFKTVCGAVEYKDIDLDDNIVTGLDIFCFNKEDLNKYYPGMILKIASLDEIHDRPINPIQTYCFMFEAWEDILGYEMSEISLKNYPPDDIAAAILKELTTFGYDYETSEANRNKEKEILNKRANFDTETCVSADDFFAEMEKEFDAMYDETPEEKIIRKEKERIHREEQYKVENTLIVENYNRRVDYWDSYCLEEAK